MAVESTLVFLSIVLLVIIELSNKTEDMDLRKISSQSVGYLLFLPNLGKFSIIHTLNTLLIFLTYFITLVEYLNEDSTILFVLLFSLACLMALLPLLETNLYRNHLMRGLFPRSLAAHFWYTVVATIVLPILLIFIVAESRSPDMSLLFAIVFAALWIGGSVLYLYIFKSEIYSRKI